MPPFVFDHSRADGQTPILFLVVRASLKKLQDRQLCLADYSYFFNGL